MSRSNLDREEQYQRLFVKPLVEAVRAEVKATVEPLVEKVNDTERRVASLEKNQLRALTGFAGVVLLVSTAWGLALDWVRKRVGW